MYKNCIKRLFDMVFSLLGMIILSPLFLGVALAIKIDDRGPIFFKQQRIGAKKSLFWLYKFRSMKTDTPDIPTHLLDDPEQYISRVGKFIRKTSIDELPQMWNIFKGDMSIIGPRPAVWNQDDLIAERYKYGANDVRPGLTGLAQVSGRDELEIPVKARLDGEYTECLNTGRFKGFKMDIICFFKTITSVLKHDGVVEGGTGELEKEKEKISWEKLK